MSDALIVRPAEPHDLVDAGRVCVEAYEAAGQLDDGPHRGYGVVLADTQSRFTDAVLLVAARNDRVIGTVTICPSGSTFSEIARDGEVEFRFLAVASSSWGVGVGDALIDACQTYAREVRASRLVLSVRDTNTSAMAMYVRRGFRRMPERDWQPVPGVNLLGMFQPVVVGPTGLEPMTSSL